MTPTDLRDWRNRADLSQGQLAVMMGLNLRQYQNIESGEAPLRAIHLNSLEHLSLKLAVDRKDVGLAFPSARSFAVQYAALFAGQ